MLEGKTIFGISNFFPNFLSSKRKLRKEEHLVKNKFKAISDEKSFDFAFSGLPLLLLVTYFPNKLI